jgi:hypothetical protein
MREAVITTIIMSLNSNQINRHSDFLYSKKDWRSHLRVRKPDPNDRDTIRNLAQIPPEEIALAFTKILEDALSISRETLIVQTARLFGIDRISNDAQQSLDHALEKLISQGAIIEREGRLSLGAPEQGRVVSSS